MGAGCLHHVSLESWGVRSGSLFFTESCRHFCFSGGLPLNQCLGSLEVYKGPHADTNSIRGLWFFGLGIGR